MVNPYYHPSNTKPHKYGAVKTDIDNIKFDSKKEARRYCDLVLLKKAGVIKDFECQPAFILQPAFRKNGKAYREIKYIADFKVIYPDGRVEIEDIKTEATKTDKYRIKQKLFEYKYPDLTIKEII